MPDYGTGQKFTTATTVVAGAASVVATVLSVISIWLQAKNYRKPLLQRYVVRILLMVPIYSIASWTSMVSLRAAAFVDPIRDIYEAFTIYTFFQLLINYLGGERAVIIMTHGRAPVHHLWPMNHFLPKVDISDPHTFLAIKRGILQYAWLKPILALAAIIMKATGTYQEGYIGAKSGYFWSGIIYNISVTVSLYSLGLFWVCMHRDLVPFRPVPKFLCIKLIIFASYWQGFFLSILVWLGAIPDDVQGYTRDNLAAAIQDALICVEMPIFAVAHWYAFSWHDFADNRIQSARMPLNYAIRDAFGIKDLIEDSKETFRGDKYRYRVFDSGDRIMAHEDSRSRFARLQEGMRYERGGKGKYWIPKPGEVNATSPLLGNGNGNGASSSARVDQLNENTHGTFEEPEIDPEEDHLYAKARELEFGDWNYPVITASEPLRERYASWASSSETGIRSSPPHNSQQGRGNSNAAGSAHTSHQQGQQTDSDQPPPVVVVKKKKKKSKKAATQPEPAPADSPSTSDREAQSSTKATAAAPEGYDGYQGLAAGDNDEPWASAEHEDEHRHTPSYQVSDSEEFRNVWGGDK
ncbi:seven transmembrane receptor, rhodopsin family [Trichoderma reesei QM6a]|uniref:Seven transmembrane receptor, rhodopsin family n=2 Tax=Hypocrea jecorina TaxID=51453 RepID=G0RA47_HYPJQ|nr:seven transmembrane receptor, rhodopsin family [Trichoderma reesei QM6a]EGR51801.1 seven transmembrane receptor, rhodopsin family [Trichoderma reesei QM6a]